MGTVKGAKALQSKLSGIANIELRKAMNKATLVVEGTAKELAPVDTGDLRGSIHPRVEKDGHDVIGIVSTSLEYAPFMEFGTGVRGQASNMNDSVDVTYNQDWEGVEAQPYLYPAITLNRERIKKILGEDLQKAIRKKATK